MPYYLNIWPNLCVDNLPLMGKIARSYGRYCDWSGYWGKDEALDQRRRERNSLWC